MLGISAQRTRVLKGCEACRLSPSDACFVACPSAFDSFSGNVAVKAFRMVLDWEQAMLKGFDSMQWISGYKEGSL